MSHFASAVSDDQQEECRANATPANTDVTLWGIQTWEEWATDHVPAVVEGKCPVTTPVQSMPVPDFVYWLRKVVLEVRKKKDASEYPPKTLYRMVCCFKRFFEQNKVYSVNPLASNAPEFGEFRQTLDAEMKRLHRRGLGSKSNQAEPITEDDDALLWAKGELGTHSAQVMLNTVYYYSCKVFGLRSYDEHRNLQCSQFIKKVDEKGLVYIKFMEYGSKCQSGGLKHMKVENNSTRIQKIPNIVLGTFLSPI